MEVKQYVATLRAVFSLSRRHNHLCYRLLSCCLVPKLVDHLSDYQERINLTYRHVVDEGYGSRERLKGKTATQTSGCMRIRYNNEDII